jgi:hypothetical protein
MASTDVLFLFTCLPRTRKKPPRLIASRLHIEMLLPCPITRRGWDLTNTVSPNVAAQFGGVALPTLLGTRYREIG